MTTTHTLTLNSQGHATSASKIVDGQSVHPSQKALENNKSAADPVNISPESKVVNAVVELSEALANVKKAHESKVTKSSEETVATASADSETLRGSFEITVTNIARVQKSQSAEFSSATDNFGSGELSIKSGDADLKITVAGNLHDVAKQINEAKDNFGVKASVVELEGSARLVIQSQNTGKENQFTVSASGTNDSGNGGGFELVTAAQDATGTVNGRGFTSASNEIEDETSGITLNIKARGATRIAVADDEQARSTARNDLLRAQQRLTETAQELEKSDNGQYGGFLSQLKNLFSGGGNNDLNNLREKLSQLVKDNKEKISPESEKNGSTKITSSSDDLQVGATDKLRQMLVDSLSERDQKRMDNRAERANRERSNTSDSTTTTGSDQPGKSRSHDHSTHSGQSQSTNNSSNSTQDRRYSQLKAIVDSIS